MSEQPEQRSTRRQEIFARAEKRARRWIWGCTGGCLGVMVAIAVLFYLGIRYLMQPVPVVPPELFIGSETTVFLSMRVEADDPLMLDLPYRLATYSDMLRLLPFKVSGQGSLSPQQSRNAASEAAPVQMVAALRPGAEPGDLGGGVAFSLHRGSRLLRSASEAAFQTMQEQGATLSTYEQGRMAAQDGQVLAYRTNNFMLADRKELARRWMEQLARYRATDQEGPGAATLPLPDGVDPAFRSAYERLDRSTPIRFAASNAHGELGSLLARLQPDGGAPDAAVPAELAGPQVRSLSVQIQPLNAASANVLLMAECADPDTARALSDSLEDRSGQSADKLHLQGVLVTVDGPMVRAEGVLLNASENLGRLAGVIMPGPTPAAAPTPPSP